MRTSEKLSVGFLFDDTLDSNDGVAQYVKNLGLWLSGQGHHVFYLCGETKLESWAGGAIYSLSKNIGVSFNDNWVRTPLPASRRRIREALAKEKPDILHVQVPYSPLMAGRVISAATSNTAVVGTFHIYPAGLITTVGVRLLKFFCLKSLKRFDQMLAVSQPALDFASATFGIKPEISSNVVELAKFKATKTSPQPGRIVFLGRLVRRKGAETLLKAFFILKQNMPKATLVVAGDGPQRARLEELAKKQKMNESVIFLGYINEKDKPSLLASAEIACFPSTGGESFGIVLIEAMAAGAGVVIGGDNPGYGSVFGERPELLVEPKNYSLLADRLRVLMTNKDLSKRLHEWQQERVKRYDIDVGGPKVVEAYQEAIAKRSQNRHNKT